MDKILNPEYLLPIIAIAVSIFSLTYSVYYSRKTFRLAEEHNKKSVEPIISHLYSSEKNVLNQENICQSLQIKNCGFGPAIINSFVLIIDNKPYDDMLEIYKQKIKQPNFDTQTFITHNLKNYVIASNESLTVFKFSFKKAKTLSDTVTFHDLAKKVSLKMEFETIYSEKRSFYLEAITE